MKEGWKHKKLSEVCCNISNIRWQNVPSDATYTYIDLSAVDRDSLSIVETIKINKDDAPSRAKQIIQTNDVLFGTTRPTLKRVCLINKDNNESICSTGFCVLRANETISLPKWIFYQLLSNRFYSYIEPLQSGASYPAVTDGIVKSFSIPIPSLTEQQHIVEELDLLSSIIEKKKSQLNELDNLAQSLFYEMFGDPITNEKGWEVKKLGEICSFSQGIQVDVSKQSTEKITGWNRFLRIVDYTTENDDIRYVNVNDPKYILNKEDIAMVRYGASVGTSDIGKEGVLANNLFKINYSKYVFNKYYLLYSFHTMYFKAFIHTVSFGAAMPALSFKVMKDFQLLQPPLSCQQSFASKIESIEHQKDLIKQSIKEVETLFNSRMDYYFN